MNDMPFTCPSWCRTDHAAKLERDIKDRFTLHSGEPVEIPVGAMDAQTKVVLGLGQCEDTDGRTDPVDIEITGADCLTPFDARRVAAELVRLANIAEGTTPTAAAPVDRVGGEIRVDLSQYADARGCVCSVPAEARRSIWTDGMPLVVDFGDARAGVGLICQLGGLLYERTSPVWFVGSRTDEITFLVQQVTANIRSRQLEHAGRAG